MQNWILLQELAAPLTAVFALVAAVFAALAAGKAARAVRSASSDARLRVFLKFSDEYEKLKVGLPVVGDRKAEAVYLSAMGQPKYQLAVFNVCRLFEREHQLHALGLVPADLWAIWHNDMLQLFAHKPVRDLILKNREQFRKSFITDVVEG